MPRFYEQVAALKIERDQCWHDFIQARALLEQAQSEAQFLRRILANMTDARSPIRQNITRDTGERYAEKAINTVTR